MKDGRITMPDGKPLTPNGAAAVLAAIHDAIHPGRAIIPPDSPLGKKLAELYRQILAMPEEDGKRLGEECFRIASLEMKQARPR